MLQQEAHAYWVILASFVAAYVLAVVSIPVWLMWARPEWVALTLIYWTIALPHRAGVFTGLVAGVLLDSLEGAALGQNALALVVVALLCLTLYQRLRQFSVLQQAGMVFVLVGINQLVCQWVQNLQNFTWTEEEVNDKLERKMVRALDTIWKVAAERKVSQRTAAFIVAIGRVGKARVLRGIGA